MKKILYVVLDGLADRPIAALDNKTPLEAANRPHLNNLAKKAKLGSVFTVGENIAPESDIAVISLLGYDAHKYYTGRGPLESFAEGLSFNNGDLAFRVNFATIAEDGKTLKDRRVGRNLTTEEATALSREINSKVTLTNATFEFKNTIGHRGVLVFHGMRSKLSGWVTNTDPAYEREGVFGVAKEKFDNFLMESKPMPGYEKDTAAIESAKLINEFTQKSMLALMNAAVNKKRISESKMPGNVILSRDAGDRLPKFPSMKESLSINFGSFVEMPVEKGIALLTGMEVVDVPSSTGHWDIDYSVWAKIALEKIKNFDGLYIHIKGPDEPAHDGNFQKKKDNIEAIDKFFFANLVPKVDWENTILAVTADHATPCNLKAHSDDPVPLLICGGKIQPDNITSFSEKTVAFGSLKKLLGKDIMRLLISFAKE
ncbi:MAG: alkaline phosphatase family protein [Candidatus Omnitrophota bacterium]|nr:alkaline phosphatase family protein [Candidatus Omnitrophota bacterium]